MPVFTLDFINYVVTGNRQKILNLDFKDYNGKSVKNVSFFTDNEAGTYEDAPYSFSYDPNTMKNRNEHGFVFLVDPTKTIRALYDVKDVALKSAVAKQITNRKDDFVSSDVNIEMYFPHLRKDPLGFVQMDSYSYGVTDRTPVNALIRRTDLYEKRNLLSVDTYSESFGNPIWEHYINPYDKYGSDEHDPGTIENLIPTYLYTPLSNLHLVLFNAISSDYASSLSVAELSDETIATIDDIARSNTSSYWAFLSFFKDKSADVLSNLFKPVWNFRNIDHNYIMEVPLERAATVDNQYHFAFVNADMVMAKNLYDDIYNTNVEDIGEFKRVRNYQNIGAAGRKLFLTYFDDVELSSNFSSEDRSSTYMDYDKSGEKAIDMAGDYSQSKQRDYMKIECIDSINRFVSTTAHKANLYSTKVYGVDKLLEDERYDWPGDKNAYRNNIKQDIKNSIRRIVSNFAPAHTQYYDVVDFIPTKVEQQC